MSQTTKGAGGSTDSVIQITHEHARTAVQSAPFTIEANKPPKHVPLTYLAPHGRPADRSVITIGPGIRSIKTVETTASERSLNDFRRQVSTRRIVFRGVLHISTRTESTYKSL